MGRVDRLRIERIRAGDLSLRFRPESVRAVPEKRPLGVCLTCKMCGGKVLAEDAKEHIKHCWDVQLGKNEPIPILPTRESVKRWIEQRRRRQ